MDLPLYAFQTDLPDAHVLDGARAFIKRSAGRATQRRVLVNRDPQTSHLDPLTAAPPANDFLRTVKPFLDNKVFGEKPKRPGINGGHKHRRRT